MDHKRIDLPRGPAGTPPPALRVANGSGSLSRFPDPLSNQEIGKAPEEVPNDYFASVVRVWEREEPPPRQWVMGGWIPQGAITVLFGDGGMGKSYLALHLAQLACLGGSFCGVALQMASALYLDAELEEEEFIRRAYHVARGLGLEEPPENLHYLRLPGSIAQAAVQVKITNTIHRLGVGFTVLDSLSIGASGDNPSEAEDIIKTMTALNAWGTMLAVDHITKAHAASNMAYASQFGSVFKRNIARSSIRLVQAEGGGITLQHDKSNFGPRQQPLYVSQEFESLRETGKTTAVYYRQVSIDDDNLAGIHDHLPAAERVYATLAAEDDGRGSVPWLADQCKMASKTVNNHLTTLRKKGRVTRESDGLWCVVRGAILKV